MQFNQAPAPRESSLGDAYDPTADYAVDDLCIHDNVLYKCTTAISGGEAWDSTHWTETNIADEISALNSNIANLTVMNTQSLTYGSSGKSTQITVPSGYIPFMAVPQEGTATDAYVINGGGVFFVSCSSIAGKTRNTKIYFIKV